MGEGHRGIRTRCQLTSFPPQTGRVVLGGPGSYFWQGKSFLCCPLVPWHAASHPRSQPEIVTLAFSVPVPIPLSFS